MKSYKYNPSFKEFIAELEVAGIEDSHFATVIWRGILNDGSGCERFDELLTEISGGSKEISSYLMERALEIKNQRVYEERIEDLKSQNEAITGEINTMNEEAFEAGINPTAEVSRLTQSIVWNTEKIKKLKSSLVGSKEKVSQIANACDVQTLKENVTSYKEIRGVSETVAHNINSAINRRQNRLFDWFGLDLVRPLGSNVDDIKLLADMRELIVMLKLLEQYKPKFLSNYTLGLMDAAFPIGENDIGEYSCHLGKEVEENYKHACTEKRSKK